MSRPESVIHNIGYRRYEGARLGRWDAGKAIASQTLTGAYGIGRGVAAKLFPWLLVAGTLLPAVIILAVMNMTNEPALSIPSYTVIVHAFPALFIAVVAPHAVSRDLRFGLMPLYFSRPITTGDYVNARYAGAMSALFILVAAPLLVLFLGEISIGLSVMDAFLDLLVALTGALLLTLLFTGIGLLLAAVTPRRGLGIAAIVAVIFGSYGATSIMQGMLMTFGDAVPAQLAAVFSPVTLVDAVQAFWFGTTQAMPLGNMGTAEGLILTGALVSFIVLSYLGLRARFRKVSSQ